MVFTDGSIFFVDKSSVTSFRCLFTFIDLCSSISGIVDNLYYHLIPNRFIYRSKHEPLEIFHKNNMGLPFSQCTTSFPSQKLFNTLSSGLLLFTIVSWRAMPQMYMKLFSSRLCLFNSTALSFLCAHIKHRWLQPTQPLVSASHVRASFIFQMFLLLFLLNEN